MQAAVGVLPDAIAKSMMIKAGVDRLAALHAWQSRWSSGAGPSPSAACTRVLRAPMPLMTMFDKQMRPAHGAVQRAALDATTCCRSSRTPAIPSGSRDLATHRVPLEGAPQMYDVFKKKEDGCIKVVLQP